VFPFPPLSSTATSVKWGTNVARWWQGRVSHAFLPSTGCHHHLFHYPASIHSSINGGVLMVNSPTWGNMRQLIPQPIHNFIVTQFVNVIVCQTWFFARAARILSTNCASCLAEGEYFSPRKRYPMGWVARTGMVQNVEGSHMATYLARVWCENDFNGISSGPLWILIVVLGNLDCRKVDQVVGNSIWKRSCWQNQMIVLLEISWRVVSQYQ
jgi:hypothetical protein